MGKKKENNEGVSFYLLLALGMHHGGRNLAGEKALVVLHGIGKQIGTNPLAQNAKPIPHRAFGATVTVRIGSTYGAVDVPQSVRTTPARVVV